jgi:hypothetical protein
MMSMKEIYEDIMLVEMLDSPSSVTHSTFYGDVPGYKHATEHFLKDGTSFFTFHKDGCMEIHHSTQNNESGTKLNHDNPINVQWVSDAFHIIKPMVDSGNRVRVIGTTDIPKGFRTSLLRNYQGIAKHVANKHGYHMTPTEYEPDEKKGSFILTRRAPGFIGDVQKNMLEYMTEENGYVGLGKSHAVQKTFGLI